MNNKTQKMKRATKKTRNKKIKNWLKKIILFPWRAIKWLWRLLCRICRAIWNWLKSIDIIGMINLTLLVAIIVLFLSLISNFVRCNKCAKTNNVTNNSVEMVSGKNRLVDNRKVVQRKTNVNSAVKSNTISSGKTQNTGAKSQKQNPKQTLSGDVVIDVYPSSQTLSNDVYINGNLILQNMRKFTLPCGAKINGNLIIRNVNRLNFCGEFSVSGNIYVNRESSFGPIPSGSYIGGNIIL